MTTSPSGRSVARWMAQLGALGARGSSCIGQDQIYGASPKARQRTVCYYSIVFLQLVPYIIALSVRSAWSCVPSPCAFATHTTQSHRSRQYRPVLFRGAYAIQCLVFDLVAPLPGAACFSSYDVREGAKQDEFTQDSRKNSKVRGTRRANARQDASLREQTKNMAY